MSTYYHYGYGVVHHIRSFDFTIKPFGSSAVITVNGGQAAKAFAEDACQGMRVVFSWLSQSPGAHEYPRYVDPTAVECIGLWERTSSYIPKFSKSSGLHCRLAEQVFIRRVREFGLRIEHATPFEDERLGIDAWWHCRLGNRLSDANWHRGSIWRWIPIDFTYRRLNLDTGDPSAKKAAAKDRGVVPIKLHDSLDPSPRALTGHLRVQVHTFLDQLGGIDSTLMTRERAMTLELDHRPGKYRRVQALA